MEFINRLLATFFYTGYLPIAPGTWGSLGAIIIWWFVPSSAILLQSALIVLVILIGVFVSQKESERIHKKDPSEVVIDEVAGMWLTLFLIPKSLFLFSIGFLLFRFFDVTKPWIIDRVQSLRGGYGIMMDDIIAGIFSWIILLLFIILL